MPEGGSVPVTIQMTVNEPLIKDGIFVHPDIAARLDNWFDHGKERTFLIPAETHPAGLKITIRVARQHVVSITRGYDT